MQDNYIFQKYEWISEYAVFTRRNEEWSRKIHKTEIADAFCTYGGSFVKCLGDALYHADHINSSKLLNTRSGYVEEYANKFIFPTKPYYEEKQREPGETNKGVD